jgi:hypothetical protein
MRQAALDYFQDPVVRTEITTDVRKKKTVEREENIPGLYLGRTSMNLFRQMMWRSNPYICHELIGMLARFESLFVSFQNLIQFLGEG